MSHHTGRTQTCLLDIKSVNPSLSNRREKLATSSAHVTSEFTNPDLEVLLSEQQIQSRIKELGAQITRDYAGRNPLLIGVLKGACFFLSDLLRAIDTQGNPNTIGVCMDCLRKYDSAGRN